MSISMKGSGWSGLPAEKCMVVTALSQTVLSVGRAIRLRDGRTK